MYPLMCGAFIHQAGIHHAGINAWRGDEHGMLRRLRAVRVDRWCEVRTDLWVDCARVTEKSSMA